MASRCPPIWPVQRVQPVQPVWPVPPVRTSLRHAGFRRARRPAHLPCPVRLPVRPRPQRTARTRRQTRRDPAACFAWACTACPSANSHCCPAARGCEAALNEQLQTALNSRVIVEQVKGKSPKCDAPGRGGRLSCPVPGRGSEPRSSSKAHSRAGRMRAGPAAKARRLSRPPNGRSRPALSPVSRWTAPRP